MATARKMIVYSGLGRQRRARFVSPARAGRYFGHPHAPEWHPLPGHPGLRQCRPAAPRPVPCPARFRLLARLPHPRAGPGAGSRRRCQPSLAGSWKLRLALRGAPYRNGGSDPSGFDCSGFVWYVFSAPRDRRCRAPWRSSSGPAAPCVRTTLQPGDLVFFDTGGGPASHVGVVVERGRVRARPELARRGARRASVGALLVQPFRWSATPALSSESSVRPSV